MVTVKCPICGKDIHIGVHEPLRRYTGATVDCPECKGTVYVQEDNSSSDGYVLKDFGPILAGRYKEMGLNVSPKDAVSSYVDVGGDQHE